MYMLCRKLVCVILTVMLAVGVTGTGVYAADTGAASDPGSDEGIYIKSGSIKFNKDFFTISSYTDDIALAKASVQMAWASSQYYDGETDPRHTDPALGAQNLINILKDKGFKGVKANKYYTMEGLEDSMAVAVGRMSIKQDGKTYTLLAVIPRSLGYKQEWASDIEVGNGMFHKGFKAGRDEVLRFVKKYIQDNKIKGNLKVWLAGHSRGAAVANMVAGFLAGGGSAYLGKNISIKPENIYCRCFAVPKLIKKGIAKKTELSVAGARSGRYAADTAGKAYTSSKSGTLNPQASIYKGIKTYMHDEDMIAKLPCKQWKLTFYGTSQKASGTATWNEMMNQLKAMNVEVYEQYTNNANPKGFKYYTFDVASIKMVPDKKKSGTLKAFLDNRVAALNRLVPSNAEFVSSGTQEALAAVGAINGMLFWDNTDYIFSDQDIEALTAIRPVILTYMSYVSEKTQDDQNVTEPEAIALWLEELLNYMVPPITEKPKEYGTVDDVLCGVSEFVENNRDSELVNQIVGQAAGYVSEDVMKKLRYYVRAKDSTPDEEVLKDAIVKFRKSSMIKEIVYPKLADMLKEKYPEIANAINGGKGSLTNLSAAVIKTLAAGVDGKGDKNRTLAQITNDELSDLAGSVLYKAADKAQELYGEKTPEYGNDVKKHVATLRKKVDNVRRLVSYLLFNTSGNRSIEAELSNVCTFISNGTMLAPAHYCEGYTAWMSARAAKEKKCQYLQVTAKNSSTVRKSVLKKKSVTISVVKASGNKGKLTYRKASGKAAFSVNKKTGKITVKKGTKKGTYKIKISVTAASTKSCKLIKKTVQTTVKVR